MNILMKQLKYRIVKYHCRLIECDGNWQKVTVYESMRGYRIMNDLLWMTPFTFVFDERHSHGPVSISDKMSYRKISWRLEATRFVFRMVRSLLNLTGSSAGNVLFKFQSDAIISTANSRLRDFTRSYDKTSDWILKRNLGRLASRAM